MLRIFGAVFFAFLLSVDGRAATGDEVASWKREFPNVGGEASFEVRNLVSAYEAEVLRITPENIASAITRLKERAQRDISDAVLATKAGESPSAQAAREKHRWLAGRLLPFLGKMG